MELPLADTAEAMFVVSEGKWNFDASGDRAVFLRMQCNDILKPFDFCGTDASGVRSQRTQHFKTLSASAALGRQCK